VWMLECAKVYVVRCMVGAPKLLTTKVPLMRKVKQCLMQGECGPVNTWMLCWRGLLTTLVLVQAQQMTCSTLE
jgi:hypothetical protein